MPDTCGERIRDYQGTYHDCGRPAGHDGTHWPSPFESDKTASEEGR